MNEQERKRMIQNTFNAVAENYDNDALRFFPISAGHLSSFLNLKGDETLLDAATGTGHAAIAFAHCLPEGSIIGIDFSEDMLARAKGKIEGLNISNVKLFKMDMQALEFPANHFDAAVCAFGLFFVDDMNRQLSHICDKVKRGGGIVITSFHGDLFAPLTGIFFEQLRNYDIVIDPQSLKRLSTKEECAALFENAGLSRVHVEEKKIGYYLKNASQWWDVVWNAGLRRFVNMLAPQDIENFKREHLRQVEKLATDEGIWLEANVLYTSGVKS